MTSHKLELYGVTSFNDKMTLHTARAVMIPATKMENGIEVKYKIITTITDPMKNITPWVGDQWTIERESQPGYNEFIHLYPKDKTKTPLDLWNETLAKKLSDVFDLDE